MKESLFSLLLYSSLSLSYDLIQLGIDLTLLSKTPNYEKNPEIAKYIFRLMDVYSEKSNDYVQINLFSCYDGTGLEDLYRSFTHEEIKKIEKFINVIESDCACILYFFLTEGINKLDVSHLNLIYSETAFHLKDDYEKNCLAKDYLQAVVLFKYLNQTTNIEVLKNILVELLNQYNAFELISENRDSN